MTQNEILTTLNTIYLNNFNRIYTTKTQDTYIVELDCNSHETVRMFNGRVSDFVSRLQSKFIIVSQEIHYDKGHPTKAEIEFTWGIE